MNGDNHLWRLSALRRVSRPERGNAELGVGQSSEAVVMCKNASSKCPVFHQHTSAISLNTNVLQARMGLM